MMLRHDQDCDTITSSCPNSKTLVLHADFYDTLHSPTTPFKTFALKMQDSLAQEHLLHLHFPTIHSFLDSRLLFSMVQSPVMGSAINMACGCAKAMTRTNAPRPSCEKICQSKRPLESSHSSTCCGKTCTRAATRTSVQLACSKA